ncbi:kinase-like protein [Trametes cingulata]|nr:kinase-like protein [Trametes cingulata]
MECPRTTPWGALGNRDAERRPPTEEAEAFWEAARPWLAAEGVTLYDLRYAEPHHGIKTWCPPPTSFSSALPFAKTIRDTSDTPRRVLSTRRIAHGQDSAGRDVLVKIISKSSSERDINEYLLSRVECSKPDSFPSVLAPSAIIDTSHDYAFLVMPLWTGGLSLERHLSRVDLLLTFIRCVLTGLVYLHEHRIAHRDIREENILLNFCFPDLHETQIVDTLEEHLRDATGVVFCLADFDLSLQVPRDTSLRNCRRSSDESRCGFPLFHPYDTLLGEPYYNPFAYDVACLGKLLIYSFTDAVPTVPFLAPLFAKMTTHVIHERFTAAEALQFFKNMSSGMSAEGMARSLTLECRFSNLDNPDSYWSKLSAADRLRWRQYETPAKPWTRRALEWMTSSRFGWAVVSAVRRTLSV